MFLYTEIKTTFLTIIMRLDLVIMLAMLVGLCYVLVICIIVLYHVISCYIALHCFNLVCIAICLLMKLFTAQIVKVAGIDGHLFSLAACHCRPASCMNVLLLCYFTRKYLSLSLSLISMDFVPVVMHCVAKTVDHLNCLRARTRYST